MSERKHIEAIYEKIKKKYPDFSENIIIRDLALKAEQRKTVWVSLAFLLGSVLCALAYALLPNEENLSGFIGLSVVFFIVCAFEYFRTILNAEKIKYHFLGECITKQQGILTHAQITKKMKASSPIHQNAVKMIKAVLYDKDDKDNSYVSFIYHTYYLYFKLDENFSATGFRVKRRDYLRAPLDAEYILVMSDEGEVLDAYLANEWKIDPELYAICEFDCNHHNAVVDNAVHTKDVIPKNNKQLLFEILILILNIAIYFLYAIIGFILLPFMVFYSTLFVIKDKKVISVINAACSFCNMILYYLAIFMVE